MDRCNSARDDYERLKRPYNADLVMNQARPGGQAARAINRMDNSNAVTSTNAN